MEKEVGSKVFFETEFINFNSRDCSLLIEFLDKGFTYSILQNSSNTILFSAFSKVFLDFFSAEEEQFSEVFATEKVFQYIYGKIIVLIDSRYSTLVPNTFFNKSLIKETLSFGMNLPETSLIYHSDEILSISYHNLFISTENLTKSLDKAFVSWELKSSESVLLRFLNKKNVSNSFFHMHVSLNKIQCIYFENKNLKFNNSFIINTDEDILYNVLNIYKQLGLNTEKVVLNISGVCLTKSERFNLIFKYIKHIEFSKRPLKLNYSKTLKEMPENYFVHHFMAFLEDYKNY